MKSGDLINHATLKNKNIILGVSGGIAAYKSAELLRSLVKHGANVKVFMTKNAKHFIAPMTFETLSEKPVCCDLFLDNDDAAIAHIEWASVADAVVIAPATANIIAKLAAGIADDALSTFLLAVTKPICCCPAMNTHMYESKQVQRNLNVLRKDGVIVVEPDSGELACGTTGPGRLPDTDIIIESLIKSLCKKDFTGKKFVITAGPTREYFDPIRFISNPSTGKMGYAIARAAILRGADVTLITGPTSTKVPHYVKVIKVETAKEMATAVFDNIKDADIIIKTAAVSDYKPKIKYDQKVKKDKDTISLEMEKNIDILKNIGARKSKSFLVGFAAETQELKKNAQKKLKEKNLDMIVGNVIGQAQSGFEKDTNKVTFFFKNGKVEELPVLEKETVAHVLLDKVKIKLKI